MYAGTKVNWHEVLMNKSSAAATDDSLPLFLCAFSADKGSEDITDLQYKDFKAMYGTTADYFKYGQPLVQAHKIAAAGGRILGKRIVADDATLGNLVICASVTKVTENKKNASGQLIYLDGQGNETTEVTDTLANTTYAKIKYELKTLANAKSFNAVMSYAPSLQHESAAEFTGYYPLFVVCDNGRGASVKNVRITPDYEISRSLKYMLYKLCDVEEGTTVESVRFAVDPTAINTVNGVKKNMTLYKYDSTQFTAQAYTTGLEAFVTMLSNITGYTTTELYTFDILFGKTVKEKSLALIKIDEDGEPISATAGMKLQSGTNGSFGSAPFPGETASAAWGAAAADFFNGGFSDEIYDLDQHKISFCVDANYPKVVKEAIAALVDVREDFFFFRDMGLDIHTVSDVQDLADSYSKSPFIADYLSSYEVLDIYSRKQIKVTMMYGLAPLLVAHYTNNIAAPVAGEFNNFVITEYISGTLNLIPRITPALDQKTLLDDIRVNYVNLTSEGLLAIQSTYTSQDHIGPLSYINNVLVTQRVIKAIRNYCPKIRFMLMDSGNTDFSGYKTLIEDNVISKYSQYFTSISLNYVGDDDQVAAKIFNASIYCYYRDFPQGEVFDVFAIEGNPENNPMVTE